MIAHSIPASVLACLLAVLADPAVGQEWLEPNRSAPAGTRGNGVRHPNLLLNQGEIDQVKQKIREHDWAARLLERVKAKAEKDNAVPETALAYALTGQTNYAVSVRS